MTGPWRRSSRFRLITACVAIQAVMLVLLAVNGIRLAERHLESATHDRAHDLENSLAAALVDGTIPEPALRRLAGLPGIVYVVVEDEAGNRLATAGAPPSVLPEPDPEPELGRPLHRGRVDAQPAGQPPRRLHYALSTAMLTQARHEMVGQAIAIAVLALFFSTFTLLTIGLLLSARLKTVSAAHMRLAAGDFDTVAQPSGDGAVAALARSFNVMAGAIGDKVAQLEAGSATLRAANAELQRLADLAANHLRAPVASLDDGAATLRRLTGGKLDGEADAVLARIANDSRRAHDLLDGLRSFLDIDMTPLPPDARAELNRCADDARQALAGRIAATRATIAVDDLPAVHGDPAQVAEILRLLLENALDHRGDRAPHIRIHASVDAGRVVVGVTDNGPGVPQQFRERVFELFETVNPGGSGTGFGLAAVRKMVRRHLGNVWITPAAAGGGLTVNFTLPRAK